MLGDLNQKLTNWICALLKKEKARCARGRGNALAHRDADALAFFLPFAQEFTGKLTESYLLIFIICCRMEFVIKSHRSRETVNKRW